MVSCDGIYTFDSLLHDIRLLPSLAGSRQGILLLLLLFLDGVVLREAKMKIVVLLGLLAMGCAAPQFTGRRFQFNPTPRPFRSQFQPGPPPPQQFQPAPPRQFQPLPTPQPYYNRPVATIRDLREDHGNGHFRYEFETENGIRVNAVGTPGSKGQSNIAGGFSFPFPEGGSAQLTYVADEFGYRPESPLLPTPHPLPAHAIEQIRIAEEQRARGIRWDK
ncbi:larval cuticle protein LCP-22-like [Macrobrachium nipponense]|uniref:larval cuticle protein LCP-22-like n=1 Tax=Macrobrachium nipponense TaxID=159736 RepID=UPI0030C81771